MGKREENTEIQGGMKRRIEIYCLKICFDVVGRRRRRRQEVDHIDQLRQLLQLNFQSAILIA